jgi:hypothetical protein
MIRQRYFNCIEEKLNILAYRIETRGKLNIVDLNIHSETFYQLFFNKLFQWELMNMNIEIQNAEAIDLIDRKNKIIIQVSSTATKEKIEKALKKDLSSYDNFCFKFISISKDAEKLRGIKFINTKNITFDPKSDIFDIPFILKIINNLDTDSLKNMYEFVMKELEPASGLNPQNIQTNLATIINILSKENWEKDKENIQIIPYDIDRKIDYNNLSTSRDIIEEYKIHYNRVDSIYSEFNKEGVNKSKSVLDFIRREYFEHKGLLNDDELFSKIVTSVVDRIEMSSNYIHIPFDELELCVSILVVDAFMRCRIFENPEGYSLVTS